MPKALSSKSILKGVAVFDVVRINRLLRFCYCVNALMTGIA